MIRKIRDTGRVTEPAADAVIDIGRRADLAVRTARLLETGHRLALVAGHDPADRRRVGLVHLDAWRRGSARP